MRPAMRPEINATGITISGPGVIASPAIGRLKCQILVIKKKKPKNIIENAAPNPRVARFTAL
jgi:hypothetical protein